MVGESPLKVVFSYLLNLAFDKGATVADLWEGGRNEAIGLYSS